MGTWRTPYELVLPGTTPDAVRLTLARHHQQRAENGLYVSLRERTLRANVRDNPRIRGNNAPWLKATVQPDPGGTRITGILRWDNLVAASWGGTVAGLFLAGVSVQALTRSGLSWLLVGWLILTLAGGVVMVWYSARQVRNGARQRAAYVRQLDDALAALLGAARP